MKVKGGKAHVVSLFGVALDVADVGGDFHGSIWFRPEAAVDCAVQRGLNIIDTCDFLRVKGPCRYSHWKERSLAE